MLTDDDIQRIARAVVDEIEERGAAMQELKLQMIESQSTIALQDKRIAELEAERNAIRMESRDRLSLAEDFNGQRVAAGRRISELEALVNELRCGDLVAFQDDELSPDRAVAFRTHLDSCANCQTGLKDLVQLDARVSELAAPRKPTVTR